MSLDIYIKSHEETTDDCMCHCGNEHKHTYYPEIEHFNITHNLGKMAAACDLYNYIWRPDENGIETCKDMVFHLKCGLQVLKDNPETFKKLNPENGWGSYNGFVAVVEAYLICCTENPNAKIEVCR